MSGLIVHQLAEYGGRLCYEDLDGRIIHEAKRKIIDTLGCAIGAFNAPPIDLVRQAALEVTAARPATLLGTRRQTTAELATFVNTAMSRYLDFMDTYFHDGEYVHPSDNIAALLAVADSAKCTGRDVILATVLAYETCCRLTDFASIRRRGWDHVIWLTVSTALASSRLMGLTAAQTAQALAISVASSIPLRQTRVGQLSMWKGLAVAYATMAGVFAAGLARRGVTGPEQVFEGKYGLFNQVTGKSGLAVADFCRRGADFKIAETHIKKYPAEYNSMSAIEAALALRQKAQLATIKEVNITTFTAGYEIIADKEKWYPANRETADHSLPYIVSAALLDGEITERQFAPERFAALDIRQMLDKVKVSASPECDAEYYPGTPSIIEIVTVSGEKHTAKVVHPRGSYRNPMSDAEIEDKLRSLVKPYLKPGQAEAALAALWDMENQEDIAGLMAGLVVKGGRHVREGF